jgi:phage tail protein X
LHIADVSAADLGAEAHVVTVLEANPGLADRGPVYPAGILITLPAITTSTVRTGEIRLWGRT